MTPVISGKVVDEAGAPVAGASVAFGSGPVSLPDIAQLTGPTGDFALSAPAAGDYRLTAHAGQAAAEQTVQVGADNVTDIQLQLSP